jgi:RNA polymerase sigma-70 factor (ECF subfamily)
MVGADGIIETPVATAWSAAGAIALAERGPAPSPMRGVARGRGAAVVLSGASSSQVPERASEPSLSDIRQCYWPAPGSAARREFLVEVADLLLVERSKQDDIEAYELLVDRYRNKILNYVARYSGSTADAEDLTQEVFIKAYLAIKKFRGQSSFQTWIFQIANNVCVDRFRRTRRERIAYSLDDPVETEEGVVEREIPDWSWDPEAVAQSRELQALVQKTLTTLSDKLRPVIILHDLEGMRYEEIAEILNIPLGTVKSRLFNARVELRNRLRPYMETQA